MGRVNYLQTNFTAGEITPRLDGRVDISKYKNGVKELENFLLLTHGGVTKRPGSMFVAEVADSSKAVRLQEFEFSTTQAYVLEFGDLTIRFYANNGRVESGGSPVEVVTPYTEDELPDLRFTQSADVLYISHADHPIKKLSRTSSTAFTLTDADIVGGPFQPINGDDTLILYIAIDSTITAVTGATQAKPCVITAVSHGYQSGECVEFASVGGMTALNGNRYFIIKLTDDTFSLRDESYKDINSSAYGAYTSGGTVHRSITKWGTYSDGSTGHTLSSDFEIFTSEHVGALVRLWEPGQATGISGEPVKDATVSNSSVFTTDSAVYGFNDLTGTTLWLEDWHAAKHKSGVVKVSSLDGTVYFDQVYLHDISCVLKITAVTDAYTATVRVVKNHVPNSCITIGTHFWEMGSWNDFYGYPRVLAFHEQRLWAASSNGEPQTVWGSVTDGFEDFSDGSLDDSALSFQIASDKVDLARWMDAGKTLVLGTVGSEYSISATEQGQGITPSNVKITRQTEYGSTRYEPVRVGHKVVFPQRHGLNSNSAKKLREYGYSFEQDNYLADDLTIISEQITGTGIQELCYQAEPNNLIWSNRDDGQAVVCTYQRAQDVVGWCRQIFGGTDAKLVSLATIPGNYGDQIWFCVERTIDGATVKYIDYMTRDFQEADTKTDGVFFDSALTYDSTPTTTISGLDHLEGETVGVIGDGSVQPDQVVSSGAITLARSASIVHVGLKYTSKVKLLAVEAGARMGTAQSRIQRVNEVWLRLYRSLGGKVGINDGDLSPVYFRKSSSLMDDSPDLRTGHMSIGLDGFGEDLNVVIEHDQPYPFTLLSVVFELTTQD